MEIGNKEKIMGALNNLGNLHSDLQLQEQALHFYSEAYHLSEKLKKPFPDALNNMGNLYFQQGNYPKAIEQYTLALALAKQANNHVLSISIRANMGEALAKRGEPENAQAQFEEALKESEELKIYFYKPQILKNLADNYATRGKLKEAYETMVAFTLAVEKVHGEESSRKIAQMELALNLVSKEKEIEALKKDNEIATLKLKNITTIITSIVLGLGALIMGFNIYFTGKKNSRK